MQEKTLEELGGKIHTILNKTIDESLTTSEYQTLVKLINVALEKAREEGRNSKYFPSEAYAASHAITQYKEELLSKLEQEYEKTKESIGGDVEVSLCLSQIKKIIN